MDLLTFTLAVWAAAIESGATDRPSNFQPSSLDFKWFAQTNPYNDVMVVIAQPRTPGMAFINLDGSDLHLPGGDSLNS